MNKTKISNKHAITSIIFGIISFVTILIPIINILASLAALYFAREGIKGARTQNRLLNMTFALSFIGFGLGALTMLKHVMFMINFSLTLASII